MFVTIDLMLFSGFYDYLCLFLLTNVLDAFTMQSVRKSEN